MHYEIDLSGLDGIDSNGLRREWDEFYGRHERTGFSALLRERAAGADKRGIVLSFPSNAVFDGEHLAAARRAGIEILIVFGAADLCLEAFLNRERASGRGFDAARWHRFNDRANALYARSEYGPHKVAAFRGDGSRYGRREIVSLVRSRLSRLADTAGPTASGT